jgi:glutaredoxin 3
MRPVAVSCMCSAAPIRAIMRPTRKAAAPMAIVIAYERCDTHGGATVAGGTEIAPKQTQLPETTCGKYARDAARDAHRVITAVRALAHGAACTSRLISDPRCNGSLRCHRQFRNSERVNSSMESKQALLHRMVTPEHTCPWGVKSFELLKRAGYEVEDHQLTTRSEVDTFMQDEGVQTTPQTYIDGQRIGGYDELVVFLGEK